MNFWTMLASRTFQTFVFALCSLAALCVLMALHIIDSHTGLPLVTAVIGFGIGVPVTTKSNV